MAFADALSDDFGKQRKCGGHEEGTRLADNTGAVTFGEVLVQALVDEQSRLDLESWS